MKKIYQAIMIGLAFAMLPSCTNQKPDLTEEEATPAKIDKVVGVARIEPEKGLLYIYSTANGKIQSINADVNENVKQEAVLVSLENATDAAQLNIEESKILTQKAVIRSAEINANAILSDLQKAKEDVVLNEQLFAAKAITEQTLNDSKAKASKLQIEYQKQLSDVEQAKNKMAEINASVQYQQTVIASKQIKAPFDGKVLQWDIYKGDYVTVGQKLGQYAPDGALIAKTEVDELFAEKVKTGMKADIISQLNGEKIGEGEVVFVAGFLKKKSLFSDENTVEDRRVKEVKVRLKPETQIAINNRVDCIIYLNK